MDQAGERQAVPAAAPAAFTPQATSGSPLSSTETPPAPYASTTAQSRAAPLGAPPPRTRPPAARPPSEPQRHLGAGPGGDGSPALGRLHRHRSNERRVEGRRGGSWRGGSRNDLDPAVIGDAGQGRKLPAFPGPERTAVAAQHHYQGGHSQVGPGHIGGAGRRLFYRPSTLWRL